MSDETCHKVNCNDEHPRHTHHSNSAGDAGGAGAVISVDAGQANPNCPEGYIWGGLNCVKDDGSSTVCDDGFRWDGSGCADEDGDCSDGYYDLNGVCTPCPSMNPPTVEPVAGWVLITLYNPIDEVVTLTYYVMRNGQAPTLHTTIALGIGNLAIAMPTTGYSIGDELCIYYSITPLVGSAYYHCHTAYSKATCKLLPVI